MIPPSFADLGKAAKDLFDKKFKAGVFSVDCSSSVEPVTLKIEGKHNLKTKELSGTFETKHKGGKGLEFTTKWSSANVLTTEICQADYLLKGFKASGIVTFEPETGKKNLKLKDSYKRHLVNLNTEILFKSLKPTIQTSIVLGCTKPYLAGIDTTFDTNTQTLKNYTVAIGYEKKDFGALLTAQQLNRFTSWIYQKISDRTEVGICLSYNKNPNEFHYGVACQYKLLDSKNSFIKGKINQNSRLSLAYGCTLNDNVQMTVSGDIDMLKFEEGPHNVGIGLTYEQ